MFSSHSSISTKVINGTSGLILSILFIVGCALISKDRNSLPIRPRYLPGVLVMVLGWVMLMFVEVLKDLFGESLRCGPYLSAEVFFFNMFLFGLLYRFLHLYTNCHYEKAATRYWKHEETVSCEEKLFDRFLQGSQRRKNLQLLLATLFVLSLTMLYNIVYFVQNPEVESSSAQDDLCELAEEAFDTFVNILHIVLIVLTLIVGQRLSRLQDNYHIKDELKMLTVWSVFVVIDHQIFTHIPSSYIGTFKSSHFFKYIFPAYILVGIVIYYPLWLLKGYVMLQRRIAHQKSSARRVEVKKFAEIELIIDDPALFHHFMIFLSRDFCAENLFFVKAVCQFRFLIDSPSLAYEKAQQIIYDFIADDAILMINVSGQCKQDILRHFDSASLDEVNIEMFERAYSDIMNLLIAERLPRFKETAGYLSSMDNKLELA